MNGFFRPSTVIVVIVFVPVVMRFVHAASEKLPDLDKRRDATMPSQTLTAERATATEALQQRIPGVRIDMDEILTSPKFIYNRHGFLSGSDSEDEILHPLTVQMLARQELDPGDPHRRIKQFLDENAALFGYDSSILNSTRIRREYVTAHNGARTIVWEQRLDDIPVFEAVLYGHITKNGELVSLCSQWVSDPAQDAHGRCFGFESLPGLASKPVEPVRGIY